jgi:hypothetical protein
MRFLIAASLLATVTGCGAGAPPAPPAPSCAAEEPTGPLDVKVLHQTDYTYPNQAVETPEQLAREQTEVVVVGKVTDWRPHWVKDEWDRSVVMRVRVEHRLQGERWMDKSDDLVNVPFHLDPAAAQQAAPDQVVADFRRAVPRGTRVLLFLDGAKGHYSAPPQGVVLQEVGADGRGRAVFGMTEVPPMKGWDEPCGIDGLIARLHANGFPRP